MGSSSASVLLTACASLVVPHIMWQMEEHRSVVACSVSYFIEKWGRRPTQTELVTEAIDGEMTQFVIVSKGAPKFSRRGPLPSGDQAPPSTPVAGDVVHASPSTPAEGDVVDTPPASTPDQPDESDASCSPD